VIEHHELRHKADIQTAEHRMLERPKTAPNALRPKSNVISQSKKIALEMQRTADPHGDSNSFLDASLSDPFLPE
jgi:hypothetical protein